MERSTFTRNESDSPAFQHSGSTLPEISFVIYRSSDLLNPTDMLIVLILFTGFYVLVMPFLHRSWVIRLRQNVELTKVEKQWGLGLISIAAILWVFVVPFAYLEILAKTNSAYTLETAQKFVMRKKISQKC